MPTNRVANITESPNWISASVLCARRFHSFVVLFLRSLVPSPRPTTHRIQFIIYFLPYLIRFVFLNCDFHVTSQSVDMGKEANNGAKKKCDVEIGTSARYGKNEKTAKERRRKKIEKNIHNISNINDFSDWISILLARVVFVCLLCHRRRRRHRHRRLSYTCMCLPSRRIQRLENK